VAKTGFITALKSEAKCLSGSLSDDHMIAVAGIGASAAERSARNLIASGCERLISFGLAGALSPDFKAGDVVLADRVVDPSGAAIGAPPADWVEAVAGRLGELANGPALHTGGVVSAAEIITSPVEKTALHTAAGCLAVEMEAAGVARAAQATGVAFLCVKAISDTADQNLPVNLSGVINPDGTVRPGALLGGLVTRPGDIVRFIALSRGSKAAHASLRRVGAFL